MNPQQMAMELRVLRAENAKLNHVIKALQSEHEKEKAIEAFMASALSGYCSQPRAASDDFWEKDHATGVLTPKPGGPKWAADQAMKATNSIIQELENIISQSEPPIPESVENFETLAPIPLEFSDASNNNKIELGAIPSINSDDEASEDSSA
jgi:hypothetical protein